MALLDSLPELNTPEGQGLLALGLQLLQAQKMPGQRGALGQALGQGGMTYLQTVGQARDAALKRQYTQSQLDENAAQAEERKQKIALAKRSQDTIDSLLGVAPGGSRATALGGAPGPQAGASVPGMMGPPEPGAAMPQIVPVAAPQGGEAGGSGAGVDRLTMLSQQFRIPVDALKFDIAFNGGKGIAEMVAKAGAPKWENINGNLVNVNAPGFAGGIQGGLSAGNDGRVTAWQPDGKGGIVVGAPTGALQTFQAYQNAAENTKANYDPITVTPQGQSPQMTTRGALVRNPAVSGGNGSTQIPAGVQNARDGERNFILQSELAKAEKELQTALFKGDQSAAARAQGDIAALRRELGGKGASVGLALQSEEEKLRGTEGVKGDAKANEQKATDIRTATKFLNIADQAEKLLKAGPTSSGAGALADAGAAFFGRTLPGAATAQQLKAIGGWLVANVPRMEGPQSNFDVANYQVMAADVANDSLPVDRRLAALGTIQEMMRSIAGIAAPKDGLNLTPTPSTGSGSGGGASPISAAQPAQPQAAKQPTPTKRYNPATGKLEPI